ncbi:MAG: DUF4127 family protein [Clostridia bacterium]|nr:DUF4127 family protein [Clostridia bacterium]
MRKIVYLPLDERPCNYQFPAFISEDNKDYYLVRPAMSDMGSKKTPADHSRIAVFLREECKSADALILSVDTLLYGGIVPSRLHCLTEEELGGRLALIRELKEQNPALKIYAFSLIMRCPSYSSSDEEPDYYGQCGREIFLTGQVTHKLQLGLMEREEAEALLLGYAEKTSGHLEDFLHRRAVNLEMLKKTLLLVGKEIERFVIPQDDSSPYGYTAMDQLCIKEFIRAHGLRVEIYPGADEVGLTMLAAAVNQMNGKSPVICPIYPDERCKALVPLYEDRAVFISIRSQIESAGAVFTENPEEADILLFCNLPIANMLDVISCGDEHYHERKLDWFTSKMQLALFARRLVAAADIAYCNGGDVEWLQAMDRAFGVFNLCGYAGWNTSSNTLGTVICQACLCLHYGFTPAHNRFTALRVFEDVGYCAHVRKKVCDEYLPSLGLNYFHTDGKDGRVAQRVKEELTQFVSEIAPAVAEGYEIDRCEMPWSRMFEVGITVKEKEKKQRYKE